MSLAFPALAQPAMRGIVKSSLVWAAATSAFFLASPALAHNDYEFVAQGGYGFSGTQGIKDQDTGDAIGAVSFDAAPVFLGLVGYRLEQDGFIYLSYSRQSTTAYYRDAKSVEVSGSRGVAFDNFQFGGYLESWRGPFAPFMGASVGFAQISALGGPGNDFFFEAELDAGVKWEIVHWMHLRFTGRLPFTFLAGESSALCV